MDISRKEFILGLSGASAAVSGCVTVPSPESVGLSAQAIGGSVGVLLNEHNLSAGARSTIVTVVTKVVAIVPDVGQDRETLWTKMAREHVDGLVAGGKLKDFVGCLVMTAFSLVIKAFGIFESRYPAVKTVRELMDAALDGFGKGFLTTFSPTQLIAQDIDVAAYKALKASSEEASFRMLATAINAGK